MFAGETSVSNPSAMSQSCNRLSLSILMMYNLASTTMLPGLKMEKYIEIVKVGFISVLNRKFVL